MSSQLPETEDRPFEEDSYATFASDYTDQEVYEQYRAISWSAVAALTLAVFSLFSFLFVPPLVVAAVALALGLYSLMIISSRSDELAGAWMAKGAVILGAISLFGAGGMHTFIYLTEVPEGHVRIGFGDLQPDASHAIPPESALALDGQQVYVKGYMLPGDRSDNITKFILVPDLGTCCFGGDPKITDMIEVTLTDHPGLGYNFHRYGLGGTLHVEATPTAAAGGKGVLYRLDADYVR